MIPDMISNKKLNLVVVEIFIRGTKTKHLCCFYHAVIFQSTKSW